MIPPDYNPNPVIDARPALDERRTGVGHYARRLTEHLPAAAPQARGGPSR